MKKMLIVMLAVLRLVFVQAQTENTTPADQPIKTLFNSSGPIGWWISPDFAYTQIDNRTAWLGGLSAGIIINHNVSIGLGGYGIANSNQLKFSGIVDTADVYLYGGYGGLKLEYRFYPTKVIHFAFPVLIGGGSAAYTTWQYDNYDPYDDDDEDYRYAWDNFFVIEPGVALGINLLDWLRFDVGASYRYIPGLTLPKTDSNMLCGFSGNFSLKFGKF